jgi:hypothetical protein
VNTGDSQLASGTSSTVLVLLAIAGVLAMGSAGLVVARRRVD